MKKAKTTTSFVCQECGYDTPSWLGKCPECGSWNSLKEIRNVSISATSGVNAARNIDVKPQPLSQIAYKEKSRIQTEYEELNTVMGVTLIAGDPGVGKSTLLLQLALSLSQNRKVLYVSGEESVDQVKMRAERVKKGTTSTTSTKSITGQNARDTRGTPDTRDTSAENLFLLSLTDADAIVAQIEEMKPDLVVIDSIQTIESQNVSGLSGSVGQVRYSALQFVRVAKHFNIPIVIVGHVTKEGMVAGPMVLSHMVDTVLFLEGEKFATTRILRSLKNRFGPVDEVGIFIMEESGMSEATNPEQLFLDEKRGNVPGSVLVATLEGSRAFLVELQALAVFSKLPMPRRVVSGVDPKRVELLLAVLQKHAKLPVDTMDIFVNIAGGLRLTDPAIDLGICLAVYSSLKNISLSKVVGISEVGLLGELRTVAGLDKRVREAKKLGHNNIITAKTHKTLKEVIDGLAK
jgi:DNA repair protein RadA/Sms